MHLYLYNADRAENQNLVSALSITINKILCQFFEFTQNVKRSPLNVLFSSLFIIFLSKYLEKQNIVLGIPSLGVFIMLEDKIPFCFSIVSIFTCNMFNHCHENHLPFSSLHISFHKYPGV